RAATNYEGKKEVIYHAHSLGTLRTLIQPYQTAAKYPLLISIDDEWGLAMRIENTAQYPYAISLGAIQGNLELIHQMGENIAQDCKLAGIHWNLAPVADINNNPDNPVIGYRSFGEDKVLVSQKAIAYMKGMQQQGLLTSVKHFPGHGDTSTDSHLALPLIDKTKKTLLENELYPFKQLILEGVDSVMAGHLSVPALADGSTTSSSISKDVLKGLLRREMGYKGVIVSDALNMHAVSKNYRERGELEWLAFDAGNDVLCFAENSAAGIETIFKNASSEQIEESFARVWELKEKAFASTKKIPVSSTDPDKLNRTLALESLTLYSGTASAIASFKEDGFVGINVSSKPDCTFFNQLKKSIQFKAYDSATETPESIERKINPQENILLAVYPPKVKPQNNFDLSQLELDLINDIMAQKKVTLYLFGNPYFLNLLNLRNTQTVVIAYQDFEVFQENAANHFLGKIKAKGKLPVTVRE
ncbi:MAG: glycoside hydrolase family 3 protein, partial [Flavobacteriaceae bacterium]